MSETLVITKISRKKNSIFTIFATRTRNGARDLFVVWAAGRQGGDGQGL